MSKQDLAKELRKPIIRKFEKRKVHSSLIDSICGAYLGDIQQINIFNKRFRFLLCVISIYSKYLWVVLLNGKKGITITNAFQKDESGRNPKKIWVDKESEFYKRSTKLWLQGNEMEMYSTQNEGKYVVALRLLEP